MHRQTTRLEEHVSTCARTVRVLLSLCALLCLVFGCQAEPTALEPDKPGSPGNPEPPRLPEPTADSEMAKELAALRTELGEMRVEVSGLREELSGLNLQLDTLNAELAPPPDPPGRYRSKYAVFDDDDDLDDTGDSEGFLTVNTVPNAKVYIDGKLVVSDTPLTRHPLASGNHTVRVFYVDAQRFSETKRAVIKEARHVNLFFRMQDGPTDDKPKKSRLKRKDRSKDDNPKRRVDQDDPMLLVP